MDPNAQFERLRELLHQPPSAKHWELLCLHLHAWPESDEKLLALEYAEAHLTDWDDVLRTGPIELWWEQFPKGQPRPEWRIVRTLRLEEQHLYRIPPKERFVDSEPHGFSTITGLHLIPHNLPIERTLAILDTLVIPSLQSLFLCNHQIGPEGAHRLSRHPACAHLVQLELEYNHIGDAGLMSLAEGLSQGQLRKLNLRANGLTPQGFELWSQSPMFARLTHLDIGFHPALGMVIWEVLRRLPFGQLRQLCLDGNQLGVQGAQMVASAVTLQGLEQLGLSKNDIGDAGAKAIATSPHLTQLKQLDLSKNDIGPEGARALGQSETLTRLTQLNLSYNPLGAFGLLAISKSPQLKLLAQLDVRGVKM